MITKRRGRSTTSGLLAATVVGSGLALLSNLALFWREVVSAAAFGIGLDLDTFILASLLPIFLSGLFANSIAPALIPALAQHRKSEGADGARRLLTAVHVRIVPASLLLCLALWSSAELLLPILCQNCGPGRLAKATNLFQLLVPLCAIQLSSAVWKAALTLEGNLVLVTISPAFAPLIGVALISSPLGSLGVDILAWSLLLGAMVEWLVLASVARHTHTPVRPPSPVPLGSIARNYGTLLLAATCTTSVWLIDSSMASGLAAGSVAALTFGGKIVTFGVGIAGIGISQAVMPVAVELAAHNHWWRMRHLILRYSLILGCGSCTATVVLMTASEEITRLLYERGAFGEKATQTVAAVQFALAAQIPFHVLGVLFVRMLSVLQENRKVLVIAALGTVLNIGLNLVLMPRWGVVGIAAATSVMFAATCVASGWCLRARMEHLLATAP